MENVYGVDRQVYGGIRYIERRRRPAEESEAHRQYGTWSLEYAMVHCVDVGVMQESFVFAETFKVSGSEIGVACN